MIDFSEKLRDPVKQYKKEDEIPIPKAESYRTSQWFAVEREGKFEQKKCILSLHPTHHEVYKTLAKARNTSIANTVKLLLWIGICFYDEWSKENGKPSLYELYERLARGEKAKAERLKRDIIKQENKTLSHSVFQISAKVSEETRFEKFK